MGNNCNAFCIPRFIKNWSIVDFYEWVMPKARWLIVINRGHTRIEAYFWPDLEDFHSEEIRKALFWLVVLFEFASKDGRFTKKLQFRLKKYFHLPWFSGSRYFFDPGRSECFVKWFRLNRSFSDLRLNSRRSSHSAWFCLLCRSIRNGREICSIL